MIHTLNMQCKWSTDSYRTHKELHDDFMKAGILHFEPANPESVEVQLSTQAGDPVPVGEPVIFTTYANITYDTSKDRNVSKTITGGRSIPVPSY